MQEKRAHELKDSRGTDGFWGKQSQICGKGVAPDRHVPMDGPKPTSTRATQIGFGRLKKKRKEKGIPYGWKRGEGRSGGSWGEVKELI